MTKSQGSMAHKHDALRHRATLYQGIREFFATRNVLEVETPIFSSAGNPDPSINSLKANFALPNSSEQLWRYAQTSPEFAMKRLLSQGVGSIYQICKVFRTGEIGSRHQPEFTMLEWYRDGFTYHQLMDEISDLLNHLGVAQRCKKVTYLDVFQQYLGIDIQNCKVEALQKYADSHGLKVVGLDDDFDGWLDLLLSHFIEPQLGQDCPVFIYDYPQSQAALAVVREGKYPVAERFELYIQGIEIANGYQELCCSDDYAERFEKENTKRKLQSLPGVELDHNLLIALQNGLPECAGVAMGLDRLLMVLLNALHINEVLSFDFSEA